MVAVASIAAFVGALSVPTVMLLPPSLAITLRRGMVTAAMATALSRALAMATISPRPRMAALAFAGFEVACPMGRTSAFVVALFQATRRPMEALGAFAFPGRGFAGAMT
jgi:hypothetical protein